MKYTKELIFMTFFYCFFSLHSLAQDKDILDNSTFKSVFQDQKTKKIIRHYTVNSTKISKSSENIIVSEDGNIYRIGSSKYLINYHDENLLVLDATQGNIIKYNADFEVISEFPLKYPDGNVYAVEGTSNLILTDEFELAGTVIEFYSQSYELLNSIEPHPNKEYFRVAAYQSDAEIVSFILFFQNSELCPQLIQLDSKTGKIELETCLDLPKIKNNYTIHNVKITKDYLFIPTHKKIMVFDNKGNLLWEKPIYPAIFDFDEHIHIFDKKNKLLSAIHPKSGKIIWEKDIKSHLDNSNLLLSEIISNKDRVNLLIGTKKGNRITDNIILNKKGKLIQKDKLPDLPNKNSILVDDQSGNVRFINNKKIIRYE